MQLLSNDKQLAMPALDFEIYLKKLSMKHELKANYIYENEEQISFEEFSKNSHFLELKNKNTIKNDE